MNYARTEITNDLYVVVSSKRRVLALLLDFQLELVLPLLWFFACCLGMLLFCCFAVLCGSQRGANGRPGS